MSVQINAKEFFREFLGNLGIFYKNFARELGRITRIQAISKPKTTTTQRPRNENSLRIDKKIKPTVFFFSGKVPFLVRVTGESVWIFWKQWASCLKYYFTLSLPFEQRLVFLLCCDVQIVVSIIISRQFMLIVQIPGLGGLC